MVTSKHVKPEEVETPSDAKELPVPPTMKKETADLLFGGATKQTTQATEDFEAGMYELRKLADQVLEAVAIKNAEGLAFKAARDSTLEPKMPELEFTLPLPNWSDF